ncbi:hypothetical protein GCM10010964_18670 [Caldovatus sediminis]|uniref:DUF2635 domain-containing protein n=1 Tax=Caldovatus sediminis TaxID=2041189 RepID=A0A8J3EDJ2_9PROT|nr:DUF2635 domain-containing protein [Caldovatus sediminis]GGG30997.1 hypothetical protein GCM10010964_18670 [Caldovatus sediminis]
MTTITPEPRVRVRPAAGRRVRSPLDGRPIPAEGAELPDDAFVRRLLAAGDLEIAPPAEAARAPDAAAATGEGERPAAAASPIGTPRRRADRD